MRVTSYTTPMYVIDFTRTLNFGEVQVPAPEQPADKTPVAASGQGNAQRPLAKDPIQSGIDRPAILIPADSDEVTTKILLRGLDAEPGVGDLEAGLLSSTLQPLGGVSGGGPDTVHSHL
jgi:hypothetical protein